MPSKHPAFKVHGSALVFYLCLSAALLLHPAPGLAQGPDNDLTQLSLESLPDGRTAGSEDSLKAAFIFHFIGFIQWDDAGDEYYVCIPDNRVMRQTAEVILDGKVINNRKVAVVSRSEGCHVLVSDYIPRTSTTLTVGPLDKGALIEFRMVDRKLKFAANVEKIKNSKLKISSQLLKLAILE